MQIAVDQDLQHQPQPGPRPERLTSPWPWQRGVHPVVRCDCRWSFEGDEAS